MNDNYVVLKLVSGETVMAMFEGEDDRFVKIDHPIQIKTIQIPAINREQITASPLCQFSESTSFVLEKDHIVYIKKMHRAFISHYNNFIKSYDEALIPATRESAEQIQQQLNDVFGDEEEELTLEEVNRRIDMLEAIANSPKKEESEEKEFTIANYVEGNNTRH